MRVVDNHAKGTEINLHLRNVVLEVKATNPVDG